MATHLGNAPTGSHYRMIQDGLIALKTCEIGNTKRNHTKQYNKVGRDHATDLVRAAYVRRHTSRLEGDTLYPFLPFVASDYRHVRRLVLCHQIVATPLYAFTHRISK